MPDTDLAAAVRILQALADALDLPGGRYYAATARDLARVLDTEAAAALLAGVCGATGGCPALPVVWGDDPRPNGRPHPDRRECPVSDELSGYAELIGIIDALPTLVREKRRRLGLTLRQAEAQSGVGMTTLHRYEKRETISQEGLVALLRWVGTPDPTADGEVTR